VFRLIAGAFLFVKTFIFDFPAQATAAGYCFNIFIPGLYTGYVFKGRGQGNNVRV
jgi:hypothetical protein